MKPKKLILCGWGPYREKQEIDFTRLEERGLFLITGATGAGKTTVFDAITYALYGSMSGEVREKSSVRSDFAGSDVPTYVELAMEHGGKEYHIYRNPEYLRPKKRKTGSQEMTKEREKAILTLPNGEKVEGSSEVTRNIQELLRLDYKQFKQLSMIAQGEFARLLTATPAEKSRIFREIFDTSLYDKMAGELRQRANGLYKQVMEFRHKMEEDVAIFTPEEADLEEWNALTADAPYYYDGILAFLEKNCERLETEEAALEKKVRVAEGELEKITILVAKGEQIRSLSLKLQKEEEKRESLLLQAQEKREEEKKLTQALQAKEVYVWEEKWQSAAKRKADTLLKTTAAEEQLKELKAKKEAESVFYEEKAHELTIAYEEENRKKEAEEQLKKAEKDRQKQQTVLEKLQKSYLLAEKEEELFKAEYENADKAYRHGIAGILAKELTDGVPCPVCGAVHHPDKAAVSGKTVSQEAVEEKKVLYEEKREIRVKLHGETAAAKEKAEVLDEQKRALEKERDAFEKRADQREQLIKEYLLSHTETLFKKQKKAYEDLVVTILEKQHFYEEKKQELGEYQAEEESRRQSYEKEREKRFSEEEEYHQAFLKEEIIKLLQESLQAYKEETAANQVMIEHLTCELAGRDWIDLEKQKELLVKKKEEKNRLFQEKSAKSHAFQEAEKLKRTLLEKQAGMQKISEQYGRVKKLDDAASGNNRLRLVFEQYVLAAYFEEILKAANLRLKVMSTGRYELKRVEAVGDGRSKDNLEMEVLDYYTGKYRSVKTLSGGESFKVSLALALGMSDVVQALSGGIRVEALFIDEGFGSLDSESLEQACITLQSLVEKDRLIGIISHVSELSEKIQNQIRIHKTNAGSSIEVVLS